MRTYKHLYFAGRSGTEGRNITTFDVTFSLKVTGFLNILLQEACPTETTSVIQPGKLPFSHSAGTD